MTDDTAAIKYAFLSIPILRIVIDAYVALQLVMEVAVGSELAILLRTLFLQIVKYLSDIDSQTDSCSRLFPFCVSYHGKACMFIRWDLTRTYLISAPLDLYYYTQLIGDAKNPPTLLATADFTGNIVSYLSDSLA